MNNKMILIFPPGWTPFAPYLALPQIKGYLNENGLDADIVDDNIIFFDKLLDSQFLTQKCDQLIVLFDLLNEKDTLSQQEYELFNRLIKIKLYEKHVKNIEIYKKRLRNEKENLDRRAYEEIMQIFAVALDIINIIYNQDINFTDIDFKKYRRDNIHDILSAIDDKKNNIFIDYYTIFRNGFVDNIINYEFIGFSITSSAQLIPALTLSKIIKEKNSKIIIFFGGNYITRLVNQRIDKLEFIFNYIDFISCYEGEYTLKELIEEKVNRENFDKRINNICNIVFCRQGKIICNEIKDFNICDVTLPNFDGFDIDLYFNPILILPLLTSKNCYSNCAFCTISGGTGGRKYKIRDIDTVYNHMEKLKAKYSTKYFVFVDETFTMKRMLCLSKKIIFNKESEFLWYTDTRFDYLITEEEAKLLYDGGLRKLQFGLESYNQRILDLMNKHIKVEQIRPILENCMKNNISFHLFFIIGFPKESKEEVLNTINFVDQIIKEAKDVYSLQECSKGISAFGLEKGSKVFNNPRDFGIEIIKDVKNDIGLHSRYIAKEGISSKEAESIQNEIIKNNQLGIDIQIKRLLGEEFSFFFITKSRGEADSYKFNYLEKERCMRLRENPFSDQKESYYLYYNYVNGNSVVLKNHPNALSSFEKALLNTYGYEEWNSMKEKSNINITSNPFIHYENMDEKNVKLAHDIVSGDKYELSEFIYEFIRLFDDMEYQEVKKSLIEYDVLIEEEFNKLIKTICDAKLVIMYSA